MLITEKDLETFQICPRRAQFRRQLDKEEASIKSLQQFMAIWMWTYQISHTTKCSLRILKEKWAYIVTRSQLKSNSNIAPIAPIGDLIASGFPLIRDLYDEYLNSRYQPASTMLPIRYEIPHIGLIKLNTHVICIDDIGNTILLNYSDDDSTRDTTTNLVYQTRLLTAYDQLGAVKLTNTRLTHSLPKTYLHIKDLDRKKLIGNLKQIAIAIKAGIDYPILNCRLVCPYKDICR